MASQPQQTLSASERLLAAQLEAQKQEPKVPVRTQIRQLKDPENHVNPWVKKFELARLTGKPVPKGRGPPSMMAVGDDDSMGLDEDLYHFCHDDAVNVGDIDFAAFAQELEDEDENDAEDAPPPPPKKRKRPVDEGRLPQNSSALPYQKKHSDDAEDIQAPPPKKLKRGVDNDDLPEDTTASAARKKQSRGRQRTMTRYCGIQCLSLQDPPVPPKIRGFPAAGPLQYQCSRCDVALSRPDIVRKHFEKCIELNGNPDALKWTDYRMVARTPQEILEKTDRGKIKKSARKTLLPTPAASPLQSSAPAPAPAQAPAPASSFLSAPSPSPAQLQQAQQPRQLKAHKQLTAVCGVYSRSLNDPPIQPASYRANQSKNRYYCPRCDYALSVADSVRKHFLSCIDKNGNPNALKWTDYNLGSLDHVGEDRVEERAAQPASNVNDTHSPSPVSLSAATKRKQCEDEDIDQTYDEGHHPHADAGRPHQKRQKRTHQTHHSDKNKDKEPLDKGAGLPRSTSEGMFLTTNPHPFFARTMPPWQAPAPGWLREIDMCTWQKRPGNTIPLATELALLRGEIFSIGKSRWVDPDYEKKEKKKMEERLAAKKQREADEAFLDGLTTAVED